MQRNDAESQISSKLSMLSQVREGCVIYKVRPHLRNVNDKAYEPEVIAIGPYHRGKTNLILMEEHKLRYFQQILQRGTEGIAKFTSIIAPLEERARKCYAEPINLDAAQFVEALVLDGCFIIELLRKFQAEWLRERNDPIFNMDWILKSLKRVLEF